MTFLRAGRVVAALLLLSVSTYYLLASIPFARYHFLEFAHFWWLPFFIRYHPLMMAAGVGLLLLTLRGVPRVWRRLALAGGIQAAWMAIVAHVPALDTYENAVAMCLMPLLLCGAAALLDLIAHPDAFERAVTRHTPPRQLLATAALGGVVASAVYLLARALTSDAGAGRLQAWELLAGRVATVLGHELVFLAPVAALAALRAGVRKFGWSWRLQWILATAASAAIVAFVVRRIVLSTLLMRDGYAVAFSLTLGVAAVLYWQVLQLHVELDGRLPGDATSRTRPVAALACAVVIGACVLALPRMVVLADWGMVLQKSLVIVTWVTCVLFVGALSVPVRARVLVVGAVAIVGATALTGRTFAAVPGTHAAPVAAGDLRMTLERYASIDHSLGTILDLVRPAVSDREFFTVLRDTGDVTDNPSLAPVPLHVVPDLKTAPGYRPHLIVVVVDSLRPDYLAPYRPSAAAFTPAIDAFSKESIVMRRAFTRYAGTALSQPAIWAGGLIPRHNYVQPFSAVNNLARLLSAGGYRQYVSMDEISKLTLSDSIVSNLEPQLLHPERKEEAFKFDLCKTVDELARQMDRDAGDPRPLFVFSQPQNLHIRVLAEVSRTYDGIRFGVDEYFKPAVSALQRLDGCFGRLIEDLKRRRLYDDTIIVLTSDHGDSYGEQGRWGHAFYLVPDTLRIPLIVHVPERLKNQYTWDPEALAFTTDITPTLYDLLGYPPAATTGLVGRSLARPAARAVSSDSPMHFVQSSYSRAFGLLDGDGAWLYVANANQVTEALFDLRGGGTVEVQLSAVDRVRYRQRLLASLGELNAYYVRP
jgi:hypothetical protein